MNLALLSNYEMHLSYQRFFFRYLFGKIGHEHLTLDFINSVLGNMNMGPISKVIIQNPFSLKESVTDKETVLDIKAEDEQACSYNIEMQVQGSALFTHRSLYYWAKVYSSQIKNGESYKKLLPVICINVHDFRLLKTDDRVHTCFLLKEFIDNDMLLTEHEMIHFLCLTTFRKLRYTCCQQLDDWLQWFICDNEEAMKRIDTILERNPAVKEAHDLYTHFTADKALMERYEARQKYLSDLATIKEESHDDGYTLGKAAGLSIGETNGLAKGKRLMAVAMYKEGIDVTTISRVSGLAIEEIEEILK
ncbi:MAG: Rpn family recombination-promoting nuclease/putative transposase [Deltaproteobacteria bacterium]|nr:Rpn family recombination-promoting nuclease/putative transposase [Deltaproteobacteria bacterium]MBN2670101.1 Rpn family recombination-promoting nuclease/putative transposase [Deltaproteobacteria bacterium]